MVRLVEKNPQKKKAGRKKYCFIFYGKKKLR